MLLRLCLLLLMLDLLLHCFLLLLLADLSTFLQIVPLVVVIAGVIFLHLIILEVVIVNVPARGTTRLPLVRQGCL